MRLPVTGVRPQSAVLSTKGVAPEACTSHAGTVPSSVCVQEASNNDDTMKRTPQDRPHARQIKRAKTYIVCFPAVSRTYATRNDRLIAPGAPPQPHHASAPCGRGAA